MSEIHPTWSDKELFMFLDDIVLTKENAKLVAEELIRRGHPIGTIKRRLAKSDEYR